MALKLIILFPILPFLIMAIAHQDDIAIILHFQNVQKVTFCIDGFLAKYDTIHLTGNLTFKDFGDGGTKIHVITMFMINSKNFKENPIEEITLQHCLNKKSTMIQCERTANSNVFKLDIMLSFSTSNYEANLNLTVAAEGVVIGSELIKLPKISDPLTTTMTFNGNMLPEENCTINLTTTNKYKMCCDENSPHPTKASAYSDGVKITEDELCITFNDKLPSNTSKVYFFCSMCNNTTIISRECLIIKESPKLDGKKVEHHSIETPKDTLNIAVLVLLLIFIVLQVIVIVIFTKDKIVSFMQKKLCKKKEGGKDVEGAQIDGAPIPEQCATEKGDDAPIPEQCATEKRDNFEDMENKIQLKEILGKSQLKKDSPTDYANVTIDIKGNRETSGQNAKPI